MPRVLPNPAAPRGTPISLIIQIILSDHGTISACIQYAINCFAIQLKVPWYAFIVELLLDEIAKKFEFLLWDEVFCSRMSVWLETDSPTGEMIVLKIRSMLENDLNKKDPNNNHNYLFGAVFDYAPDSGHYFLDTNPEHFDDYFGFVCDCMFPEPVVPAFVPIPQQSASPPVSEPVRNDATDLILAGVNAVLKTCVTNAVALAANSFAVGNHSTVMAIAGSDLDAQVLATEVTSDANQKALDAVTTASASLKVAKAVTAAADAGESIFVDSPPDSPGVESMKASNASLETIKGLQLAMDPQSLPIGFSGSVDNASSTIASILAKIEDLKAGTSSPLPDGGRQAPSTTFDQSTLKGVEDGAPGAHPHFSLADLSSSVDVPKSPLSNLGSNLSSGPSGTSPTRESLLLAASMPSSPQSSFTPAAVTSADRSPLAQSSSKPLAPAPPLPLKTDVVRRKMNGGGAQSSGIPNGNPPGDAQSNVGVGRNPPANLPSSQPQGNVEDPPVQVLAQSGDPPGNSGGADHPKTPSRLKLRSSCILGGKTGSASQRQEAPQSSGGLRKFFRWGKSNRVNPSQGATGDTRPPVAHSSDKPSVSASTTPPLSQTVVLPAGRTGIGGSGSSQDGTDLSASLPPPNLFGTNGKPVRPLPPIPVIPSSRGTDIRGSPPAHSQGDPPEIVPSPAHSSSSALRSAAPPSVDPPNEKPPTKWGVKIGGIERSGKMPDIAMVLLLGAHLLRLGVPLFSHIPPAQEVQAVDDKPHAHRAHAVLAA